MAEEKGRHEIYSYHKDGIEFVAVEDENTRTMEGIPQIYADFKIYDSAFWTRKNNSKTEQPIFSCKLFEGMTDDEIVSILRRAGRQIRQDSLGKKAYVEYEAETIKSVGYCKANLSKDFAFDYIQGAFLDIFNDMLDNAKDDGLRAIFAVPFQLYGDDLLPLIELEILPNLEGMYATEGRLLYPKLLSNDWEKDAKLKERILKAFNLNFYNSRVNTFLKNYEAFDDSDFYDEDDYEDVNDLSELRDKFKSMHASKKSKDLVQTKNEVASPSDKNVKQLIEESFEKYGLVGLGGVIGRLHGKLARAVQKKNSSNLNLNMMFTGNPGTGKSTVAKMIADVFYATGVLPTNEFTYIKSGASLQGDYVGQTPGIIEKLFEDNIGKVLLIDEAYALASGQDGKPGEYKQEAISVLLPLLEENRNKMCVILCGYEKEMKKFLEADPGLSSRLSSIVHFPNYTIDELKMILNHMIVKEDEEVNGKIEVERLKGMSNEDYKALVTAAKGKRLFEAITEEALLYCYDQIKYFSEQENFGNARCMSNILEHIGECQSARIDLGDLDKRITLEDAKQGIEIYKSALKEDEKRRPIGFSLPSSQVTKQ